MSIVVRGRAITRIALVAAVVAALVAAVVAPQAGRASTVSASQVDIGAVNATLVDPDTATFTAMVNPSGLPVSAHFECGVNGAFDLRSASATIGPGLFSPVPVVADLSGLLPNTTYDCRLVTNSPLGTTGGALTSVTTSALYVSRSTGRPTAPPGLGSGPGARTSAKCTITGTSKADVLRGTRKADVICGLGGKDTIRGRGGRDLVLAGNGNDRVYGNSGNDRIYGNAGRDRLFGNAGRDRLYGNSGNDRVSAADRRRGDYVSGGSGRDRAIVNRGDRVKAVERVARR
jgi:RTX calcium-binding nonapeptide repeat (4 copies)